MSAPTAPSTAQPQQLTVLVYSDNSDTRASVLQAVGRQPVRSGPTLAWQECATSAAVISQLDAGGVDLVILDGEATPYGGLGLCRQLKSEIFQCPPILVLTGRAQDAWLATWSLADAAAAHPLDPQVVLAKVRELLTQGS